MSGLTITLTVQREAPEKGTSYATQLVNHNAKVSNEAQAHAAAESLRAIADMVAGTFGAAVEAPCPKPGDVE